MPWKLFRFFPKLGAQERLDPLLPLEVADPIALEYDPQKLQLRLLLETPDALALQKLYHLKFQQIRLNREDALTFISCELPGHDINNGLMEILTGLQRNKLIGPATFEDYSHQIQNNHLQFPAK